MRERIALILASITLIAVIAGCTSYSQQTQTNTQTTSHVGSMAPEAIQYANDWPMMNGNYNNTRESTSSSINSGNVANLKLAWNYTIPGIGKSGGAASNPIILGDTVYFQDLKTNTIALDLNTGNVKWAHMYNSTGQEGPNGPAAGYGLIFVNKDLWTLAALNATTGDEVWATRMYVVNTTGIDLQPMVYDSKVYTSSVPGTGDVFYTPGGIGIIYALDAMTGEIVWNLTTVKDNGLWGHPEVNSGGGCWYPPAIDTNTGMMYWAVANPAPFSGTKSWPSGSSFDEALYTNCMIQVSHDTGSLNWYTRTIAHDIYDHDLQISPILASAFISGKQQDIVIGAGKMGNVYAFNRDSGEMLWVVPVGEHMNDYLNNLTSEAIVLPGVLGGVETVMAYSDGMVYVPIIDMSTGFKPDGLDRTSINISGGKGELVAVNVNYGRIEWVKKFDHLNVGAATVVNDLVFTATYDGTIFAFDKKTGNQLFTYKAPAGINGWPAVAGDTIVWPAGVGGKPSVIALSLSGAGSVINQPSSTPIVNQTITTPSTPTTAQNVTIDLTAQGMAFNTNSISVPAGAQVTILFNNMDTGVPHNFALYTDSSATTTLFKGDIITGQSTITYTFTAPTQTGTYFFRCDIHPNFMTGNFIVQMPATH